jgi:hypothetical protein
MSSATEEIAANEAVGRELGGHPNIAICGGSLRVWATRHAPWPQIAGTRRDAANRRLGRIVDAAAGGDVLGVVGEQCICEVEHL